MLQTSSLHFWVIFILLKTKSASYPGFRCVFLFIIEDEMEIEDEWGTHHSAERMREEGEGRREGEDHQPTEDKLARRAACRRSSAKPRCSCWAAGSEAAVREGGLVADYNDCHNSTEHDHGAGMYACMQFLLHPLPLPPARVMWRRASEGGHSPLSTHASLSLIPLDGVQCGATFSSSLCVHLEHHLHH